MSAFVNFGWLRLTSDSKHTRVETITMAMVWTPCQYQGPVGPSCPALSTPSHGSWEVPIGQVFPACPSGADPRSVLGSWPYKKTLERGLRGERLWGVTVSLFGKILLQGQVKFSLTTKSPINRDGRARINHLWAQSIL